MKRHLGVLIALTGIVVISAVCAGLEDLNVVIRSETLPFALQTLNSGTEAIEAVPGVALPRGLRAGDQVVLAAQPLATRLAIVNGGYASQPLPPGQILQFLVQRGRERLSVPVRTIRWGDSISRSDRWLRVFGDLFFSAIALATLWRGRNRAADGLALFAVANVVGSALQLAPERGIVGLGALLGAWAFYLLARVGLYVMAESMAGAALGSAGARRAWRIAFFGALGASAAVLLGPPVVAAVAGVSVLASASFNVFFSVTYLIPVALLFVGYRRAGEAQRVRLRWMLWGGALFAAAVFVGDLGFVSTDTAVPFSVLQSAVDLALAAFLYAILRHRVVDVKVVISRTLVYAATTSLVLGLFALFESLFERTALGHQASLALELVVPLGLGASLSTVHRRVDTLVDRLIFRRQYREEMALRRFANESAFVSQPDTLLDLALEQILLHVGAPWAAFYEYGPEGYRRVCERGEPALPEVLATDDLTLVKLRAHDRDVDLHETQSGLGREGYAFPLRARDHLLGVLVVGPRSGEHYAAEERELMAHVAHAVAASLFALRARAVEEQLTAARTEAAASAARESVLRDALRTLGAGPSAATQR
jgi:hypothetical protein